MSSTKTLSFAELEKIRACRSALNKWEEVFGSKKDIPLEDVVSKLHELRLEEWEAWLLAQTPSLTRGLLAAGANVHAQDDYALRWVADSGYAEIVKILLEAGANVHAYNDEALCSAARYDHAEIVKLLLEAGANIHARYDKALCWAAQYDHAEVVKILLEAGADAHALGDYILRYVVENGHREVCDLIKAYIERLKKSLAE